MAFQSQSGKGAGSPGSKSRIRDHRNLPFLLFLSTPMVSSLLFQHPHLSQKSDSAPTLVCPNEDPEGLMETGLAPGPQRQCSVLWHFPREHKQMISRYAQAQSAMTYHINWSSCHNNDKRQQMLVRMWSKGAYAHWRRHCAKQYGASSTH